MLAFLAYERRVTKQGKLPLVSLALFRLRPTARILTNLLSQVLFSGLLFLFSIYPQTSLRFTPLQSGLAVSVGSIAYILASSGSTVIARRWLGNRHLSIAAGLVTPGYLLLLLAASVLVAQWGVVPVLMAFFVLCFGQGLLYTPLMHTTLEKVTHEEVGAASGVYTTTIQTSIPWE